MRSKKETNDRITSIMTGDVSVVGTGVDPVTSRFSGGITQGPEWTPWIGPRHRLTSSRDRSSWASCFRDPTPSFVKTFRKW